MSNQQTPWLQQKLEAIWYEKKTGKLFLLPLSALFCFLSHLKKKQDQKQQRIFNIPIIVIGNINVGGTGKTPLVIRLTQLLINNGYKPCIITRGYKGNSKHWPILVDVETPASLAGDEAKLMAIRTHVPIIAGADRTSSIQYVLKNTQCDIILSDDGLQHYKMKRDMEIAVIDAQRRFGNGLCLPAGPLRELPQRLEICDFLMTNGKPALANENIMEVSGSIFINLITKEEKIASTFKDVDVYTGIGNPQRFIHTLESQGLNITNQSIFADHHHFHITDFNNRDTQTPIIMTEKDAVKCTHLNIENGWYLPVNAQLEKSFEKAFLAKLAKISKDV